MSLIVAIPLIGILCGQLAVSASPIDDAQNGVESYGNRSVPSRDDLSSQVPSLPEVSSLNPTTARQQGARQIQGINPDQATNADAITQQVNNVSAERANPSSLTSQLPDMNAVSEGASDIINIQSATSPSRTSGAANPPNDPLGSNLQGAEDQQSSVTRNGTLPAGSVESTGGSPQALSLLVSSLASRDSINAASNYLSSLLAIKLQVINRQTEKLSGKLDDLNTAHQSLNEKASELADVLNAISSQLPTIPKN